MKEKVYTHRSLETEYTAYHAGPHREAPPLVTGRGNEGEMWTGAYIMVSMGKAKQDRVSRLV